MHIQTMAGAERRVPPIPAERRDQRRDRQDR
jgi:hypothetical protein